MRVKIELEADYGAWSRREEVVVSDMIAGWMCGTVRAGRC